jgi:hypothetical protein
MSGFVVDARLEGSGEVRSSARGGRARRPWA